MIALSEIDCGEFNTVDISGILSVEKFVLGKFKTDEKFVLTLKTL